MLAMAPAATPASQTKVWFRCSRCIKATEEHEPIYMRNGSSYCSPDCRSKGGSRLYERLLKTQPERFSEWCPRSQSDSQTGSRNGSRSSLSTWSRSDQLSSLDGSQELETRGGLTTRNTGTNMILNAIHLGITSIFSRISSHTSVASSVHSFKDNLMTQVLPTALAPLTPLMQWLPRSMSASSCEMQPDGTTWKMSRDASQMSLMSDPSAY